ncbi:ParB/RepB/Spo0J family partition protein [Roseomonas terrae]|uniref:ParB/RepB/Spo0J family partition protein n=1 Tax=Neoroseomonas terrae TaxID=424799 RepID=A0ABS5EEU3_9PROT|nr:ParB/RepB/Spo0J family partition protein [Neoroseomonas terrae]
MKTLAKAKAKAKPAKKPPAKKPAAKRRAAAPKASNPAPLKASQPRKKGPPPVNATLPAAALLMLALDELGMNGPYQQRRTPAAAAEDAGLIESIRVMGVLQPILVRWDGEARLHQVVDGHRRVTAARAVGLGTIRAIAVESDERTSLAAGVAANLQRAALAPVDQWRALVHLQEKGWTLDGAALALGTPLRLAKQLDKLGRLHPDMLAAIEQSEMPKEEELAVIAAAPIEVQEAALKDPDHWSQVSKTKRVPRWHAMQAACRVDRIPQSRALFDAEASGLVWEEDLFAQPGAKDAITTRDVKGFLEHQLEALRARALRAKKLHMAEWDNRTGGPRLPAGWTRTFEQKAVGAERYAAVIPMGPRAGEILEIYALPPAQKVGAAPKSDAGENSSTPEPRPELASGGAVDESGDEGQELAHPGEDEPAPFEAAPAAPPKGRGPLTEKGRILVAGAKTTAIRCALRDRRDNAMGEILMTLVLAIAGDNVTVHGDPATKYRRTDFRDLVARLVQEDGTPQPLALSEIMMIASEAAARMIVCAPTGAYGNTSGAAAEWIGIAIAAHRDMPRLDTEEILATANGDTLRDAARAAGMPVGGSSKALRERLVGNVEGLALPGSAFAAQRLAEWAATESGFACCRDCEEPEDCKAAEKCWAGSEAAT